MKNRNIILLIIGILFISFNLRAPITSVGPIIDMIQEELGISMAAAGMLTTLPLIAFAVISPFVSGLSSKFGMKNVMTFGLVLIVLGEVVRSFTGSIGLFAGTIAIGFGIGIGNVLVPGIIKTAFKEGAGPMISAYVTMMCLFAAIGAGLSIPVAKGMDLGWDIALGIWLVLALVTLLIWLPQSAMDKGPTKSTEYVKLPNVWKSPLAWWVTLYMGIQSLVFYSLVAWLPTILMANGMTDSFAGTMALVFQLTSIPATLAIPILAGRFKNQILLSAIICVVYIIGLVAILISSNEIIVSTAVVLIGLGMGGCISLALSFIALRTNDYRVTAKLSGMSQSAGYLLAAVGPVLLGSMADMEGSWNSPMFILIGCVVSLILLGCLAGKNSKVDS